jgi:hypothetical protein
MGDHGILDAETSMRYFVPAFVLIVFGLFAAAPEAGDKKDGPKKEEQPTPAWATVKLGGEVRDLIELRGKLNVRVLLDVDLTKNTKGFTWDGPPPANRTTTKEIHVRSFQVGDAAWCVTLLDETDKDLDSVLPKLKPPEKGGLRVLMHGRLAAAKDKEPFIAHANAWGTIRILENLKKPMGLGEIEAVGKALPGKHEIGKGKFTSLAIENGWSPILVTGAGLKDIGNTEPLEFVKFDVAVSGRLIVSKQGPLVVDAKSIGLVVPAGKGKGSLPGGK